MENSQLMLEEYKSLYGEITNNQQYYSQTERLVIGGVVAAYGFLLTNYADFPIWSWWIIPFAVTVSGARCMGYYYLINGRIAPHIAKIEARLYPSDFVGYQSGLNIRFLNVAFNATIWALIFLGSVMIALWRTYR